MINWVKRILGLEEEANFLDLYKSGSAILDVRTMEEYNQGHITGSICIPLDEIQERMDEINALAKPIIACCRSGRRSGIATKNLRKKGVEIYNGGGWNELGNKLNLL